MFHMEAGKPKVGEKVTVDYDPSQRDHRGVWFAMNVEKAGKTEKGSKKDEVAGKPDTSATL